MPSLSPAIVRSVVLLAVTLARPGFAAAETVTLADRLQPLIDRHRGKLAIAVEHLENGETFTHRADAPMPTASLIKLPVMVATYAHVDQGRLALDQRITLREQDKVPGSGVLTPNFSAGTEISLRDAIRLMIAYSDNTATNLVVEQIGLPATSQAMERLGLTETKLHSLVFRRDTSIFPERSRAFGLGSTTAAEMVQLLSLLHRRELVTGEASDAMRAHLLACEDNTKIARLLPAGTRFAHKGGAVSAARCDAGILESPGGPIAICVLTNENEDRSWGDDNRAHRLCAEIGQAVFAHFSRGKQAAAAPPPLLTIGASGQRVELLQRTLNARLEPSPELNVDGDLGPITQAAVLRFQQARGLPASGDVDAATWQALGPLISQGPPIPDPASVNAEELSLQPADPRDGPPFVTCRAWTIADAATGARLWGENDDAALDPASTTKIMTAHLVLQLAAATPSILEETVTFSPRADETIGSTAGVRAGEQLPVSELLYGLLLPSGNDASVALAEHVGSRAAAQTGVAPVPDDPLEAFVAAMNRRAETLELGQTRFANPHGITAPGHQTSARALATLSHTALCDARFADYVSHRIRGCQVQGPGGYRRNLRWTNTNRLLATEGYRGVKTGTTRAAGACLVSQGSRDGRSLLVVVLGSSSSDARYADTRNLFRWAWQQLQTAGTPQTESTSNR